MTIQTQVAASVAKLRSEAEAHIKAADDLRKKIAQWESDVPRLEELAAEKHAAADTIELLVLGAKE